MAGICYTASVMKRYSPNQRAIAATMNGGVLKGGQSTVGQRTGVSDLLM